MHYYNHLILKLNLTIGAINSTCVIVYFNPIFYSKFRWLISCIALQINYNLIFHYYTIKLIQIIDNFLNFLWTFISLFRYFFIILNSNCIGTILLSSFWDLCNLISGFITSQLTSCFCCFLNHTFWSRSVAECLAEWRCFWLYLPIKFLLILLPIFLPIFLAKEKNP